MIRFHQLPKGAIFRHDGIKMQKTSWMIAEAYFPYFKRGLFTVLMWPFTKVEVENVPVSDGANLK